MFEIQKLKFICYICLKSYYFGMGKQHTECYKSFCNICKLNLFSQDNFIKHSNTVHPELFCKKCSNCFLNIKEHKTLYCKKK